MPAGSPKHGDMDAVADLLREAAESVVLPYWRNLEASQIREKQPGDLVTEADLRAEAWLAPRLARLWPGSRVIGEEAVAARPDLLHSMAGDEAFWIIDPVDGTANFARGDDRFAMIVALVVAGETRRGWIHEPVSQRFARAERGSGARLDPGPSPAPDRPAQDRPAQDRPARHTRGTVRGYAAGAGRKRLDASPFGPCHSTGCAGHEYLQLMAGAARFSTYTRLMPWDHAAGVLLLQESGATSQLLDGTAYSPRLHQGSLLTVCADMDWSAVAQCLSPTGSQPVG